MTSESERSFAVFTRGQLRDELLAQFRVGLRKLKNPETGNLFTEDEIARATQRGSRWWIQADADDLVLMAAQARGVYLAQQIRPERAATAFLYGYHGELWGQTPLAAAPGAGFVQARGVAGTVFHGSTTVPDPAALTARDVATGLRFQAFEDATADSSGVANVHMIGIDTGIATNLKKDAVLRWEDPPLDADPEAVAIADFNGGRPKETDSEFSDRLGDNIRHKPASGNRAHFRAWAREAAAKAVNDAFVYPCAMHAGSVLVCITRNRGDVAGPNALMAPDTTLKQVTSYIVPPGSPVVPERVFVVVTTFTPEPSDVTLRLSLPKASQGGWRDTTPWPVAASTARIQALDLAGTIIVVNSDTPLPSGATPSLLWWNASTSRFVELSVRSIDSLGSGLYAVNLSSPQLGMAVGDRISPALYKHAALASAVEEYFDTLGPGEVINLSSDTRYDRAARFPDPTEESPSSASMAIVSYLTDALGSSLATAVPSFSVTTPSVPARPIDGPHKLTLGRVGVYPID